MNNYYELVEYTEQGAVVLYEGNKLIAFNKMKALSKLNPDRPLAVHHWEIVASHWKNYGMFGIGYNEMNITQTWDIEEISN